MSTHKARRADRVDTQLLLLRAHRSKCACCALILSPSRNLSGFTLSLPELLMENDTHGSELVLRHMQTCNHLSPCVCVCVAAQSCGKVGLWQLSLRRGCADQGWAENQGLAVLEEELHDSSPTWEPYLLAAASPTAPSLCVPRGRIRVCPTYLWLSVWLTHWLYACLPNNLTYPLPDLLPEVWSSIERVWLMHVESIQFAVICFSQCSFQSSVECPFFTWRAPVGQTKLLILSF